MKKMVLLMIGILVLIILLWYSDSTEAYSGATHRFLTQEAVNVFKRVTGRNDLTSYYAYVNYLMQGADEEDDRYPIGLGFATRSKNHFLCPINDRGWSNVSEPGSQGLYVNAYEWAIGMPDYSWDMALALYTNGQDWRTLESLGHIAHLVQDVTVPAHTHIDTHSPILADGDDYEQYCKAMTMSDYGMRIYVDWEKISIPDTRTDYPLLKLKELFYEAAWKSYNLNHFQAQRPPSSNGSWKGELSKMYRIEYDIISRRWHIKGIGFLGQDWWECELDPGYYYIENTDLETTIPFVWQGKRGAYHLCEYFAREMLPAAVGYTAAVYKLFFETAEKMIKERGRDRYVAASGNDEFGIGTKARPYKTLGRAIQQSESGATIWVAPGSYSVDDYVYVYRKCRIIGDAVSKPVFTSTEKNGNIFRLAEPGTLVENICFIQKPGQGLTGILVFGANDKNQRVIIKNCEFMGLDSAIRTNRSSLAIESNLIRGCTWGIDFSGYDEETSSTVKANYFSGIGDKDLIVVGPSDRAEITGNTFNVAYDFSNYQAPMPRRLVANYHPTTLNARGNWWLLFGGLTPADLVGINIDVSRPLSSPDPKFQRLIIFESRGDFNADGQIDLGDFSLFVQYYGVSYGESRWNPRFDLSGNYQIDFSDFSIFAANFGARERAKMAAILGLQGFKLQDQPVVLLPNQPNPFNQETVIAYRLQSEAKVQLIIYNSLGQEVCVLADEPQGFGRHQVLWDGQDNEGRPVASGVYFYRLKAGKIRLVSRMALIR